MRRLVPGSAGQLRMCIRSIADMEFAPFLFTGTCACSKLVTRVGISLGRTRTTKGGSGLSSFHNSSSHWSTGTAFSNKKLRTAVTASSSRMLRCTNSGAAEASRRGT